MTYRIMLLVELTERKEFDLMSPEFLRYKSDLDYWRWNTTQLFLLFQGTEDELLENSWRDGPIYVLEIILYPDGFETDEPKLEIAKFEYEDIESFLPGDLLQVTIIFQILCII